MFCKQNLDMFISIFLASIDWRKKAQGNFLHLLATPGFGISFSRASCWSLFSFACVPYSPSPWGSYLWPLLTTPGDKEPFYRGTSICSCLNLRPPCCRCVYSALPFPPCCRCVSILHYPFLEPPRTFFTWITLGLNQPLVARTQDKFGLFSVSRKQLLLV